MELPKDHIAAAVAIMTADLAPAEKMELSRELSLRDNEPFVVGPRDVRVGDRCMAFGYRGDDGWALAIARDEARRELRIRFESDGQEVVWTWGPRGGGGAVLLMPAA